MKTMAFIAIAAACAIAQGAVAAPAAPAPAAQCQACHGAHGEGMAAAHVPRIAGQSADYLEKQLRDYASGSRANPIMVNFAKALTEPQRKELAAYYATLSAPSAPPKREPCAKGTRARPSVGVPG